MKWTRKLPDKYGRWWCAVKHPERSGYLTRLVEVYQAEEDGKLRWMGHAFWGMSMPLDMIAKYDIWWAPEPILEPEPPPFHPTGRKPLD